MFVSCISSKGAESFKPDDEAIGNVIGDLSPATFRVEFDEPLKLKNADIELVSCKISKLNEIIINSDNNEITVRVGTHIFAEQYQAKIPHGNYTIEHLADAIAFSLNEVMPVNVYRGWTGSVAVDKIKLTWTMAAPFPASEFQDYGKKQETCLQAGVGYPERLDDGDYVKYGVEDAFLDEIKSPLRTPDPNVWEWCGGVDSGTTSPDDLCRIGIDKFGVMEQMKAGVDAIIRPVECCTRSSFDAGYGGFGGGGDRGSYFTFEFEENENDDGTPVDNFWRFGGMFNNNTLKYNRPRKYANQNHRQINGVLNLVQAHGDQRGSPYKFGKKFHFPYARQLIGGNDQFSREAYYDTTWTGQVSMRRQRGNPGQAVPNIPESYTFQMPDTTTGPNKKAECLAKRQGAKTDRVKIRPSRLPLIKGLPQQTALNGPLVDTECDIVTPMVVAATNIHYLVGSVGKFNNTGFGDTFWANERLQGKEITGAGNTIYKMPFYRICEVDANGSPTKVVLTDGGEHIIVYDPADPEGTSLFMNDPATFNLDPGNSDDEETIMQEQIFRLTPVAADIGPDVFLDQEKHYRYSSFNLGLQRDDIFQRQREPIAPVGYRGNPNKLKLTKDIEIDVFTVMENPDGTARDVNSQINVIIKQHQPRAVNDNAYDQFQDDVDVRRVIFNANSGNWLSKNGDGAGATQLANWTTFVGAADKDGAIKVSLGLRNMLTLGVSIAHIPVYVDTTSIFTQTQILAQTGVRRTGPGTVKMESTWKTRFAPYHPVWSGLPGTNCRNGDENGKNVTRIKCIGSKYNWRNTYYAIDGRSNMVCNYEANLAFIAKGDFNAPQNIYVGSAAATGADTDGDRPVTMIKSQKLLGGQISPGPAPPPAGSTGLVIPEDFTPQEGGSLFNAGLHSVMYAQVLAPATNVDFPTANIPLKQPFLTAFAVEIQNLPLSGYLGKSFDEGRLDGRKGLGSRLPVAGIVPARQFEGSILDKILNYYYKTEYYQPVQVRLPTTQYINYLDINLRSLVTGKLLQDLIHSTEVVFRFYPLPDNLE